MTIKFSVPDKNSKNSMVSSSGSYQTKNTNNKYTKSQVARTPLTKNAQWAGSGANVTFTQPMFFSPLHTPQNWQIASKRREEYQWSFVATNSCFVTLSDFSQRSISEIYDTFSVKNKDIGKVENLSILNGDGEISYPDLVSKHYVEKKVNKIKIGGTIELIEITNDHKCIVIKREDIKCSKSIWKCKICVSNKSSSTCEKFKCAKNKNIEYNISSINASEVKKGDFFLVPFNTEVKSSIIKTKEEARYAGHLASDGWVCDGNNPSSYFTSSICMHVDEEKYVLPSVEYVFSKFNISANKHTKKSNKVETIGSSNKKLFQHSHSLVLGKGKDKKFTDQVVYLDNNLQKEVLGAYIQSDGSWNKKNQCIEITTYSPHLANQLLVMFYRCGILARGNKQKLSKSAFRSENKYRYIINVSSSECEKIKEYVPGKCFGIKTKKNRHSKRFFWKNYVVSPVVSNESYDYSGDVYDIRVPEKFTVIVNSIAINQCRFYYTNEPKVAAGIDFYAQFCMNGFKLECSDKKTLKFYEKVVKDLQLNHWCKHISHEYYMLGDVFPFTSISCPHCGGKSIKPDGSHCNHPGGTIGRIVLMNPDWIEVEKNVLASEPVFTLVPDEELKMIVSRKQPRQIYDRLPKDFINMIASGQPIILSNKCISHIKHTDSSYGKYGSSILRRLFTVLAYKTKLMTANWIIAERLILPVRVIKIGDKDRPAGPEDIADVSNQISAVVNDPNLTIVTHHAFDYEYYGATGKIHNITAEIEQIGKEILDGLMLNQALLNGEASCHSEDTLTLTDSGFKKYDQITEKDKIACYNPKTNKIEYHHYKNKYVYDYNNKMVHFKNNMMDILVTPNHRMWTRKRDKCNFEFINASDVARRSYFLNRVDGFDGDYIKNITIGSETYSIYDFCQMIGWYISEGTTSEEKRKNRTRKITTLNIHQSKNGYREEINSLFNTMFKTHYETEKAICVYKPDLAKWLKENCGGHSYVKQIPTWIKNLDSSCLQVLLDAYVHGDGSYCNKDKFGKKSEKHIVIYTSSDQLANDIEEISFKCGYSIIRNIRTKEQCSKGRFNKNGYEFITKKDQHIIYLSKGRKGKEVILDSRDKRYYKKEIQSIDYSGKVYCFTVPFGLFVTKRNDKITIQGNSYASAQVGVETLIRRLESWRSTLAEWVENHIFLPIAMMQGFIDERESKEMGEAVYIYPKLKWNDLNLRDKTNHLQFLSQLQDKQLISVQKLLEEVDIDYDQEVERMREEQMLVGPKGQAGGAGGMGGMGGMGGAPMGGGGGGMPPLDLGGGMGGGGGVPGSPAGGPMGGIPGGDMGGSPGGAPGSPMGGSPGGAVAESNLPNFKIGRKGSGRKTLNEQMKAPPPRMIKLTKLEQKMYKILEGINIPNQLFGQYNVFVPGNPQPFVIDFAYPSYGVGVEADGAAWHENIESKIRDQQRDQKLANVGWRILRFKEDAILQKSDEIKKIVLQQIQEAFNEKKNKKAQEIQFLLKEAGSFENKEEKFIYNKIDIEGDLGFIYLIGTE
jgi:very-short-patch-repair endonuclease